MSSIWRPRASYSAARADEVPTSSASASGRSASYGAIVGICTFSEPSLIWIRAHQTIAIASVSVGASLRHNPENPHGRNIYASQLETCFRRVDLSAHARRVCDVDAHVGVWPIGTQAEKV